MIRLLASGPHFKPSAIPFCDGPTVLFILQETLFTPISGIFVQSMTVFNGVRRHVGLVVTTLRFILTVQETKLTQSVTRSQLTSLLIDAVFTPWRLGKLLAIHLLFTHPVCKFLLGSVRRTIMFLAPPLPHLVTLLTPNLVPSRPIVMEFSGTDGWIAQVCHRHTSLLSTTLTLVLVQEACRGRS